MNALGFAEHGSVLEYWHKKCDIEKAGMKYIHAAEVCVTATIAEKIRDNMHCVLVARNLDGVFELNRLISKSFCRTDYHFYYAPRISMDELFAVSENIIVTSACIGGVLSKSEGDVRKKMEQYFVRHKDRCFLEIGHHLDPRQVEHNQYLYGLSKQYGVRLIAGTDTHCLNDEHVRGRKILQLAKGIHFSDEDNWDLRFKTYGELVSSYEQQRAIPEPVYLAAIENTNVLADMVEPFSYDKGIKYPHIYENPEQIFRQQIDDAIEKHPYLLQRYPREDLQKTVQEEFEVYQKCKSIDFMLLQTYLRNWEHRNGIYCGPGRGSVSGSEIAYALGITEMDSKKFGLNFFRFMNPFRISNADIDTDYGGSDRDRVKEFLLRDHMDLPKIKTSEIITFNTIAEKGAVLDVCRALQVPLETAREISSKIGKDGISDSLRKKYPEIFEYVDIVNGTIVSVGTHPSGVLVSDLDIESMVGMCSTAQSPYPVSMLNMKELDDLMYVKLDILGLDNLKVINDTCALAGIERVTPDNIDLDDMEVWKAIRDDTTGVFQWESPSARQYIKKMMSDRTLSVAREKIPNFSMLKWMSFGNGLIRPACASYRKEVADGDFYDNGFEALNQFLAPEAGRVCMQETIMMFLVKFCGYSQGESDSVRRAIAKKKGTETLLPEIERRFVDYSSAHYDITAEKCTEVIQPFLQIILDAAGYGFSWNHSDAYSSIGYMCGWLRYYYPYEFLTAALNAFQDDEDKVASLTDYASNHGIKITPPRYGISKEQYCFDREKRVIAKGLISIKFMSGIVANELYEIAHSTHPKSFMQLLQTMCRETHINARQLEILINIDFFQEFGNVPTLSRILALFDLLKQGNAKTLKKEKLSPRMVRIVAAHATNIGTAGKELKSYTITDMGGLLAELEQEAIALALPDLSYKCKAGNQTEYLGYCDLTTGLEEDRKKLYVLNVFELKDRFKGTVWKYKLKVKSIGTGNVASLDLSPAQMKKSPFAKGDIIYASQVSKDKKGYWNLYGYELIA